MEFEEKRVITYWSDASVEAQELEAKLRDAGYEVRSKFTGESEPAAFFGTEWAVGCLEIHLALLVP